MSKSSLVDANRRRFLQGILAGAGALLCSDLAYADTDNSLLVNDITELNPIRVGRLIRPSNTESVRAALAAWSGPVSIGGARYSMGGQIACPGSLHLDMRTMNRCIRFSPAEKTVRVQAGMRWRDLQGLIDPYDLSVAIMQSYANFSIGGSLSVNAHGRYVGAGPLINSVRAIQLVLADGRVVEATPLKNSTLFYGAIGGYGALGVITEVELALVANSRIRRVVQRMPWPAYVGYFTTKVRGSDDTVLHNAYLLLPHCDEVTAISWVKTDEQPTESRRLLPRDDSYPLDAGMLWAVSELPYGNKLRNSVIDPLRYSSDSIVWRNYEASQDIAVLGRIASPLSTYALEEYFVPPAALDAFVPAMAKILRAHHVHVVNVSIRHSPADPGSLLAWACGEVFSLVLYYRQHGSMAAMSEVGQWTRKLIDLALSLGGRYYLPYQLHATRSQFHAAYPHAEQLFALKSQIDPQHRFRNALLDKYAR